MKSNPLFVDSTKFHGDAIGTQVELKNVVVLEGEDVSIVITNHQGIALKNKLQPTDDRNFEARVHLNHQKPIGYHFVIERGDREILRSVARRGRAQYAIIEDWMPDLGPGYRSEFSEVEVAGARTREASSAVKSLIEKWGF